MRALVVYESMYGNTHAVATSIAAGLQCTHDVTLVPVTRATPELVARADLLVAGGPTHMHGMSSGASRRMAADTAHKQGNDLTMDPDADCPGIRGWLDGVGTGDALAVAFDTRFSGAAVLTGRASRAISHALRHHGYHVFEVPESFLVSKQNKLLPGEAERAYSWGAQIGEDALSLTAAG